MKKEQKKKSGGLRANSGRPLKYGEDSVRYGRRIPKSLFVKISKLVDIEIMNFQILKIKKHDN